MATAVYPSMVPAAGDPRQVALVKAVYWAQSAAETLGSAGAGGMYPNMGAAPGDPIQVLTVKLAYWTEEIYNNA